MTCKSLLLISASIALAQSAHAGVTVRVKVKNKIGATIPYVSIFFVGPQGSPYKHYKGFTDTRGVTLVNLPGPGDYTVLAEGGDCAPPSETTTAKVTDGMKDIEITMGERLTASYMEIRMFDKYTSMPVKGISGSYSVTGERNPGPFNFQVEGPLYFWTTQSNPSATFSGTLRAAGYKPYFFNNIGPGHPQKPSSKLVMSSMAPLK